jgi:Na+/proline symporter
MVRRVTDLRWGGVVSVLAYSLCTLLWISVGFAMKYLVLTGVEPALEKPDHAAPLFLLHHTPAWLAGLVFAGLFSAIMSTADAFLNLGAAVFVHDLPRALLGRSLEREVLWARVSTCAIAAAGALLALSLDELVAALGIFSWGTFAAALVPVMIGLGWKRATWQAAAAAMTTGLVTHLGLELLHRYPSPANPSFRLPFDVDTGAVALLASVIVFIAVSFVTRPPELDARVVTAIEL